MRGTRVYRRVVGTTPCAYTVWDEVDTNGGAAGVVCGVDEAEAREHARDAIVHNLCAVGMACDRITNAQSDPADEAERIRGLIREVAIGVDALEGADTEGGS